MADDQRPDSPGIGRIVQTVAAIALLAESVRRVASAPADPMPAAATAGPVLPQPGPGLVGKVDRLQRSRRPLAFMVGVVKKFGDDGAGRLAALVAYYGFFSLFPAMLALVTVLGFVLEDNDDLRKDIADSALGQFPVIGDSIGSEVGKSLTGSPLALVIGILGAVWAGMGAMQAAQHAMNSIWGVPRDSRPTFVGQRLRSLLLLGTVGVLLIATAIVPQVIGAVSSGVLAEILLLVAAVVLDIGVFLVAFKVLTVADVSWRNVVPGACVAGVAYAILQVVGRIYITNTVNGAQNTYGTFAIVIGLLSWMFLVAQVMVFAAEINVVAVRRLWPRSLKTDSLTPVQ